DLALELDAVRAVLGHGLSSFESPVRGSIPDRPTVRPKGPTPVRGHFSTPGRIGEGHLNLLSIHQNLDHMRIERVAPLSFAQTIRFFSSE
ncbi:MAG TPA: hypothetical protein VMD75_18930, partial [Candidatus Binataceae bacterium]|nr:hypothetical protein [Candidatus Binataceae bacterium]